MSYVGVWTIKQQLKLFGEVVLVWMELYDSMYMNSKSHKCFCIYKEGEIINRSMLSKVHNWIFCLFCSRTFLSIIGGVVAGILGFTGLYGFVFYLLLMAFTSLGLIVKSQFSIHTYFDSWNRVLVDGFLGGLMVGWLCSLHLSFAVNLCIRNIFTFHERRNYFG